MSDDGDINHVEESAAAPAPAAPPVEEKRKPGWLNRVLWVGPRVAEAREKTFGSGQPGFFAYDVGRQLCEDVVKIGETGKGSWAVLLLDTTAVELFTRAHLARAGLVSGLTALGEAEWEKARTVPSMQDAWGKLTVEHAELVKALVGPERDATMAKLSEEERASFANGLHELVMRLAEPLEFEAHRLGRALFARWSRVLVVTLLLVAGLGFGGRWLVKKLGKPNLALRAAVTVSSQFPGQGTDHTLLVDGDTDNLGFHTQDGGQQWVLIDLGKVKKLDKIVVYNRSDGYEERAVPIKIEISSDNQSWKQIAERKESFDKWTVKGLRAEGRFLRLKNTPPNFFPLAEVEAY